jgi:hypothetical protein
MHTALILTKHPDEYARLVDAEALPDLSVVATADVGDGVKRAGGAAVVLGDPTRVREALPHMSALRRCSTRRCAATTCSPTSAACSAH